MQIKKKNQNQPVLNTKIADLESYCPFCSTSFSPKKASVIGENNECWLLHVNCETCKSSIVVLMIVGEMGVSSFGLVTDLMEVEIDRFRNSEKIVADDLLDLYQLLHQNNVKSAISLFLHWWLCCQLHHL